MNNCDNCKYRILLDNGYSNWTVEGTDIDCAKSLNPHFPMDRYYGEIKECKFGDTCKDFEDGDCIAHFDVDGEVQVEKDDIDVDQWKAYQKWRS